MLNSPLFGKKKPVQFSHNIKDYKIETRLGGGGFGSVELATFNGQEIVLKRIQKNKPPASPSTTTSPEDAPKGNEEDFIQREIEAGRRLRHKGIAQIYDHFEDRDTHYFVMEYVKGGDLFTVMDERSFEPLRESDAKRLFRQIVRALQYSHSQGVYHLDLKLENILITSSSNRIRTKIVDFGLCHIAGEEDQLPVMANGCTSPKCDGGLCRKWAGSPDYCCPEILIRRPYLPEKADVWSLGVILYILLFAELPFSRKERYRCLRQGRHPPIVWPNSALASASSTANTATASTSGATSASASPAMPPPKIAALPTSSAASSNNGVSEVAKDLIVHMLQVDPAKRITIDEIIKHRWVRRKLDAFSPRIFSSGSSSSNSNGSSSYSSSSSSSNSTRHHSYGSYGSYNFSRVKNSSNNANVAASLPGSPAISSVPMGKPRSIVVD